MDFLDTINILGEKSKKLKNNLKTEEATKTALVLPFIQTLGYDIFDPLEVVPEFTADIAGLKGEKVDYAIMYENKPIMIIECKCCGTSLDDIKKEQLHRYFLTLDSYIGILTDGLRYLFYSTADDGKNMDTTPFMELNLENIDSTLLPELRNLCKGRFDLEKTLQTVNELKYNREIKLILNHNLKNPEDDFIEFLMRKSGIKRVTQKGIEQFSGYVFRALTEFIDEQVDTRLKTALSATSKKEALSEDIEVSNTKDSRIVTTEEELEGFQIVKAIMSKVVAPERVYMRDTISYCGVLLDNKNNRPICRLHFNSINVKYLETFDADKNGTKHKINSLQDIYQFEDALRAVVQFYDKM